MNLIQLKITLDEIRPPIWRRLLVDEYDNFYELHHALQIAFGWQNYHLFQFMIGREMIGIPDPEFPKMRDAREVLLKDRLTEKMTLNYEYDFGDSWNHKITVEKIIPAEKGVQLPSCSGGARKAPPEDCGGPYSYGDMLEALKDKNHPEYDEFVEWLGGKDKYDPEFFDLEQVNGELADISSYIQKYKAEAGF